MMIRQTRKLAATRDRVCADCGGKGGTNVKSCTGCKGRGVKIQTIQVWTRKGRRRKMMILFFLRWALVWCSRARLCAGSATAEERSFLQAAGERHPLSFRLILINTTGAKVAKGRRRRRRRK